ncbi:MAG: hypothetical protein O7F69_04380, partial [Alphaproteobacteria bacterium]|nr:hypothetical protein [Alphaproteobacteria bacterium]
MNPELRRNLWLELSTHRLIAMPVVGGAGGLLCQCVESGGSLTLGDAEAASSVADAALVAYGLIVVLWGGRLAAGAVVEEIRDRTWDDQKLTAIGPWAMTVGKLFGSTVYTWYGGLIALAVFALARSGHESLESIMTSAVTYLAVGVLCQAAGLLFSLLSVHGHAVGRRLNVTFFQLAGLGAVVLVYGVVGVFDEGLFERWHGVHVTLAIFAVNSTVAFALWAVLGVYRVMRAELQLAGRPWAWPLFCFFLGLYIVGLPDTWGRAGQDTTVVRMAVFAVVIFALNYVGILFQSKDVVGFRRMLGALRAADSGAALENLPLWMITYGLALASALAVAIAIAQTADVGRDIQLTFVAAAVLFLTRDIALLLSLHLGRVSRRANLAAVVYWLVLYGLVPMLLKVFDGDAALPVFLPVPWADPLIAILPVFLQAAAMA